VCCRALHYVAELSSLPCRRGALQCVAVCCSVLQRLLPSRLTPRTSTSLYEALAKDRNGLAVSCAVAVGEGGGGGVLHIEGVEYSRGSAHVKIPKVVLKTGQIVAVTGANGSGKSSLFALLQGCSREGMMPAGLNVTRSDVLALPSNDVVQLTQKPYCPKHSSPLVWSYLVCGHMCGHVFRHARIHAYTHTHTHIPTQCVMTAHNGRRYRRRWYGHVLRAMHAHTYTRAHTHTHTHGTL